MKIVVLDGYGLNPGDLSWEEMQALGELTVYDRTAPAELLERSAGAEVLITNKTVITAEDMADIIEQAVDNANEKRKSRKDAGEEVGDLTADEVIQEAAEIIDAMTADEGMDCLLYTSPSPRDCS